MSERKSFKILRDKMDADPERRERVVELHKAYDAVLGLVDLRDSQGVTQTQLAKSLGVSQPNISKIERNENVYLSTLGNYVAALGGHLEVKAVFPNHPEQDIKIALPASREDR